MTPSVGFADGEDEGVTLSFFRLVNILFFHSLKGLIHSFSVLFHSFLLIIVYVAIVTIFFMIRRKLL